MYEIRKNDIKLCDYWTYRFVRSWRKKPSEDDFQTGRLGLCKAANNFDESRGNFWSYAPTVIERTLMREIFAYSTDGKRTNACVYRGDEKKVDIDWFKNMNRESLGIVRERETNPEKITIMKDSINKALKTMYPRVAKAYVDKAFFDIDYEQTAIKMGVKPRSIREMLYQWRINYRGCTRLDTKRKQKKYWDGYEVDMYKLANENIEGSDAE